MSSSNEYRRAEHRAPTQLSLSTLGSPQLERHDVERPLVVSLPATEHGPACLPAAAGGARTPVACFRRRTRTQVEVSTSFRRFPAPRNSVTVAPCRWREPVSSATCCSSLSRKKPVIGSRHTRSSPPSISTMSSSNHVDSAGWTSAARPSTARRNCAGSTTTKSKPRPRRSTSCRHEEQRAWVREREEGNEPSSPRSMGDRRLRPALCRNQPAYSTTVRTVSMSTQVLVVSGTANSQ